MKIPAPLFAFPLLISTLGIVPAAMASDSTAPGVAIINSPESPENFSTLGGNLPKFIAAKEQPYLVTADIYIPTGRTVTIEPGVVLLFKNFTGLHVEGRLMAPGTGKKPVVFTSEFDRTYNPGATMQATPYDWNGIYIHEGGIGSTLAHCKILFSVYGVTSLTRYIKFDNVRFLSNGRSDLTIEGKKTQISTDPYSYTLSITDAKRDGVPVKILMDPFAKKRSTLRYSGLSLLAGGCATGLWFTRQAVRDEKLLSELRDRRVTDQNSPLVDKSNADYQAGLRDKNRDIGFLVAGFALAALGGAGLSLSFSF